MKQVDPNLSMAPIPTLIPGLYAALVIKNLVTKFTANILRKSEMVSQNDISSLSTRIGNASLIATTSLSTFVAVTLFCHLLPVK